VITTTTLVQIHTLLLQFRHSFQQPNSNLWGQSAGFGDKNGVKFDTLNTTTFFSDKKWLNFNDRKIYSDQKWSQLPQWAVRSDIAGMSWPELRAPVNRAVYGRQVRLMWVIIVSTSNPHRSSRPHCCPFLSVHNVIFHSVSRMPQISVSERDVTTDSIYSSTDCHQRHKIPITHINGHINSNWCRQRRFDLLHYGWMCIISPLHRRLYTNDRNITVIRSCPHRQRYKVGCSRTRLELTRYEQLRRECGVDKVICWPRRLIKLIKTPLSPHTTDEKPLQNNQVACSCQSDTVPMITSSQAYKDRRLLVVTSHLYSRADNGQR